MSQIFSFTECPIYINNLLLFVNSARISSSNSIEPRYVVGRIAPKDSRANGGMTISIDLNFNPIYKDPLYEAAINKRGLSLEIGGIQLKDGYVTKFSLQGEYGGVLQGSANLIFFQEWEEDFNPVQLTRTIYHQIENNDFQIAHTSFLDLSQNLRLDVPVAINYNISTQYSPVYKVGSYKYTEVKKGKQTVQSSIVGEKIENYVSTIGNNGSISFQLRDICGQALKTRRTKFQDELWADDQPDVTYSCAGKISSFNSNISQNDGIIRSSIEITEFR